MSAQLLAALVALAANGPERSLQDERRTVQESIANARARARELAQRRGAVLEALDGLQRAVASAETTAQLLDTRATRLAASAKSARDEERQQRRVAAAQKVRLIPLVQLLDRLSWQSSGNGGLSTPEEVVRLAERRRALEVLVRSSAARFAEVDALRQRGEFFARRAARFEDQGKRLVGSVALAREAAREKSVELRESVAALGAEESTRTRLVAELEANERELAGQLQALAESGPGATFVARRGKLPFPVKGIVTAGFGRVENPYFKTVTIQRGFDIRAAAGAPVSAVAPGRVVHAKWLKGYGNLVILDHGGQYYTLYAHLRALAVEVGQEVTTGTLLGEVGDTGSLQGDGLYFELRHGSTPLDPRPWLLPETGG